MGLTVDYTGRPWIVMVKFARDLLGGPSAKTVRDSQRILDDRDVDAVHVATPDHGHALPAVASSEAGNHTYVERPLGHNVLEGRAMVKAVARPNAIFLTGTQHRSAPHLAKAEEIVRGGRLEDVCFVRVWKHANLIPSGPGRTPDSDLPEGLD